MLHNCQMDIRQKTNGLLFVSFLSSIFSSFICSKSVRTYPAIITWAHKKYRIRINCILNGFVSRLSLSAFSFILFFMWCVRYKQIGWQANKCGVIFFMAGLKIHSYRTNPQWKLLSLNGFERKHSKVVVATEINKKW